MDILLYELLLVDVELPWQKIWPTRQLIRYCDERVASLFRPRKVKIARKSMGIHPKCWCPKTGSCMAFMLMNFLSAKPTYFLFLRTILFGCLNTQMFILVKLSLNAFSLPLCWSTASPHTVEWLGEWRSGSYWRHSWGNPANQYQTWFHGHPDKWKSFF